MKLIDTGGVSGITVENKHNNRYYRVRGIELRANTSFNSDIGGKSLDHTLTYGTSAEKLDFFLSSTAINIRLISDGKSFSTHK